MLDPRDYEGAFGSTVPNHSLPRFRNCAFEAAYPFGQVALSDPAMPVSVRMQAFNPLIPADADAQRPAGRGGALCGDQQDREESRLSRSVGNLENFIGQDGNVVVNSQD